MGRFATGVAVITGRSPEGHPFGFTANSLTSVSLDPRLVLVCVDRNSNSLSPLLAAGRFTISILADNGAPVAARFAASQREERFKGIGLESAPGAPFVLDEAIAWLECRRWRDVEAGDHVVVFGEVVDCGVRSRREPLVYFEGRYRTLQP